MICKFNEGLMDITDVEKGQELIFKFDTEDISIITTDFATILPETRLQARQIVNSVKCLRVVNFMSPTNSYISKILEQYEVKYFGITIYQWLKFIMEGKKGKKLNK